jgi:SpoVK/Ycf46/Vps4 family AAA+-type ATPase
MPSSTQVDEKPTEDYSDVGGLDKQIQELVEAVVLPIQHKVERAWGQREGGEGRGRASNVLARGGEAESAARVA